MTKTNYKVSHEIRQKFGWKAEGREKKGADFSPNFGHNKDS
jgi:hypothetical protein